MDKKTRLLIADDHQIVREGLVLLLEAEPGLEIIAEAGTGREALALIEKLRPDLVLLDISMPDMDGLEAAELIAERYPDVRVLFLTMYDEKAFFFRALQIGAAGYVLKGSGSDELLTAIHAALQGQIHVPAVLGKLLVEEALAPQRGESLDDTLTPREWEIAQLIARGYTNSQIAQHLTLSLNTVKTHRLHIYQKLNLHDRAELVAFALEHGLL